MALKHVSHVHPLMLVNQVRKEEGEEVVVCYGCQKPISSSAYSCNGCNYFLHIKCAELPEEITHPKHLEHPLTLLSHPPYWSRSCSCNVCGIEWEWFTYHCSKCEFDVHIPCVLEDSEVKHESHHHPLTVVHKEALFKCDACRTQDKDFSYFCNTCQFWIHKTCALSPSTIKHNTHDHPLVLKYSLPYIHRSFTFFCDICKEKVHPNYWVYDCDRCRYFVHVKCATSKTTIRGATSETTAEDDELESSVKFPIDDESVNLLDELLKEANLGDTNRATMLTHFSHDHPLILFDNEDEMKIDEIIKCKGCLLPIISTPFYGCEQCSFFLHGSCAEVPQELRHPCHQEDDHQFSLKMSFTSHDKFPCYSCDRFHNGFRYKCDSCHFTLGVVCALLPVKIRHEAHEHPLRIQRVEKRTACDGCRYLITGGFIYGCHICDYYVDIHCLKLAHKVKHAWDRHLLTLRYPPYSDHPDEFYCELCEEEMHPKFWLYHCRHCDQSFDIECLFTIFKLRAPGVKYWDSFEVGIHPHKLTPVLDRRDENQPPFTCKRCDCIIPNTDFFLKCGPCRWQICLDCAWSNS